jgi:hypothetical protein
MSFDTPESMVAELVQFTDTNGNIYRQTTENILKNLATKKAQGKYRADLAVQAFMYLAEAGARKYAQEYGGRSRGVVWHEMFPIDIRRKAATHWRDEFETEFSLGNYDNLLPKKYQKKPSKTPHSQKPARSREKPARSREKPTPEQARAVVAFADACSRYNWKQQLGNCWMKATYPQVDDNTAALLQQVRNQFGPSWLHKVTLAELEEIAGPIERTRLYAVRIDETGNWNMERLREKFGEFCPVKIYGVYIFADNERTYIASTTPSAFGRWVYNTWDYAPGVMGNFSRDMDEAIYTELTIDNTGEDDYIAFSTLERLLADPRNNHYTGEDYPSASSENDENRKDAWEAAIEHEQGNPSW